MAHSERNELARWVPTEVPPPELTAQPMDLIPSTVLE